jgi:hypothetical protein
LKKYFNNNIACLFRFVTGQLNDFGLSRVSMKGNLSSGFPFQF